MRRPNFAKPAVMIAACAYASVSWAQMNLADMKMVAPEPERPGDRALSCTQLASEMGEIMKKRNMQSAVASSKSKICRGKKELDRQGEERKQLMTAQMPELSVAGAVGGPVANTIVNKTNAEQAALEARQQPGRQRAVGDLHSGVGDMMGVMNDPRLMRLGMLAMDKNCAETMAPPPQERAATTSDGCDDVADQPRVANSKGSANKPAIPSAPDLPLPAGAADPFVKKGVAAKPATSDPFANGH